ESAAADGDLVVGIGLAGRAFTRYYAPGWRFADTLQELEALEAEGDGSGATWVLYTFSGHLATSQPELMERLRRRFEVVRVFPGTVGDGAIVVCRRREER
ncbi:MAG: hypothetical protein ACREQ9_11880, partial [Candidatus Binatia bacterium]